MPEPHILFTVVHGHADRDPGLQGGLAGRCLAEPGGQDTAHQHLVDAGRIDAAVLQDRANGHGAELGGRNGRKGTQKSADGRPSRGADHDFVRHLILYLITAGHPARSVHGLSFLKALVPLARAR